MRHLCWAICCLLAFGHFTFAQHGPAPVEAEAMKQSYNQSLAQRPTAVFEENRGQMKDQHWQSRPDVLYYGQSEGMNYYIRNAGISYQLSRVECWKDDSYELPYGSKGGSKQAPAEIGTYRVDAEWLGYNQDFTVKKGCALDGYNNYYNVPKGVEPALFVKQYESVTLQNLWNGIDVHYYSTDGLLETDYLVAPGADYRQIRMEIKGAELSTDNDGHLVMKTPFGEIHEGKLKVYQGDKLVAANWVIMGNVVSFNIPQFDPCLAMRIDPLVRVWGTYYGGAGEDLAEGCNVDANGNVYLAGYSTSGASIASGGHQNTSMGMFDAFLVKFNGSGTRVWATYYGGIDDDAGVKSATDAAGNVYLAGNTGSTFNIATPGSHQEFYSGVYDAFLVKFNSGGVLQWGTYFGGTNMDTGMDCVVDFAGNVYMAGNTSSTSGIALGGHQNTYGQAKDAFLAKFDSAGSLIWSTYYGGSGEEYGYSCATDANGSVYLTGTTTSSSSIASGGHTNTIPASASTYLVKFNSAGARQWATYYGNGIPGYFYQPDCATDVNGNVYLVGATLAANDIAFNGHQQVFGGVSDLFLAKFNTSGVRQWATYYGGEEEDYPRSCAVDASGNVYIAGTTYSTQGIAANGYQNSYVVGQFNSHAFAARFNSIGQRQWGSYFGGIQDQHGSSCAIDPNNNFYIAGWVFGANNNLAAGGHQNIHNGISDGYLMKLRQDRVYGAVWQDLDADCIHDANELGAVSGMHLTIQPGNYVVETKNGVWSIDSLPAGNYTVVLDTTNANWIYTCAISQTFTISNPSGFTEAPAFGVKPKYLCPKPFVSITTEFIRRGASGQKIYLKACNLPTATDSLVNAYVEVEFALDMAVQSGTLPYTNLGDNKYRINLGNLLQGNCVDFSFDISLGLSAVAGQTVCLSAQIFPQPVCSFDSIPFLVLPGSTTPPCTTPYDNSFLEVSAKCVNDSVNLTVYNRGAGNMACDAPVIIFLDGQIYRRESVRLNAGDSSIYQFKGNAQTWHIQTAQHPRNFTAAPYPIASIELCGPGTWTPRIILALPMGDVEPVLDVVCMEVNAPYDPNDKTGFPLGTDVTHNILPNQEIEYLIRFQNVGTDTAFNVVIRDTLEMDLDILSVRSGASSHPYEFHMYGQRVLEWRFENIQLPDSNRNEPASHGFVTFKVKQMPDLPDGTVIANHAGIYFDFEAPVITNSYTHTIARYSGGCTPTTSTTTHTACGSYLWNGTTYTQGGTYTYQTTNAAGCDSTATLNLTINNTTTSTTAHTACGSYLWNGTTYTQGGTYTHQTTNTAGCDSTATLMLTVESDFVAADTIVGNVWVDTLQTYTYSVPVGALGDAFDWDISCGAIASGNGTNTIEAVWSGADSCLLWVVRSNAACTDTLRLTVHLGLGSGLGDIFLSGVTLYPNPTDGLATISWHGALTIQPSVIILDALGRVMEVPADCRLSGCTLDTRPLPVGVYTVVLAHPNGNSAHKLIKTK